MAETPSPDSPPRRSYRLGPIGLAAAGSLALLLAAPTATLAQVAPGGLGTRVNGTALGRCGAGVCTVEGGTAAGRTLFHRFSQYDTRSGIRRVDLDSRGRANVVVGVGHPNGSFFNAPLRLSGSANLFWLSPGGLWFGPTGQIQGATNLLLTTAPSLRIGGGIFTAAGGLGDRLGDLGTDPPLDLEALARSGLDGSTLGTGDGPIVLAGGRLRVDRHLLLHSGAGPIRSAPGERMALEAGRSVQLSGGTLQLQGLDIQAGTSAADDLVRLRSGPLVGGGFGSLSLRDARLQGTRVLIEGSGGLELERVEGRAGGTVEPGKVQIRGGVVAGQGDVQLDDLSLQGGTVRVRAGGNLMATRLRIEAGSNTGGGELNLEAGGQGGTRPALTLQDTELTGQTITVDARGSVVLERVQAQASGPAAPGELVVSARSGADGTPSDLTLKDLVLTSDRLALRAAGDLRAENLTAFAENHWLRAGSQGDSGSIALTRTVLSGLPREGHPQPANLIRAQASTDLTGSDLTANGMTVLLEATGALQLRDNSLLMAPLNGGWVRLDALTQGEGAKRGRLRLQDTRVLGENILVKADRSLVLEDAELKAGAPGQWGLLRLETAPDPDRAKISNAGATGDARLRNSSLAGQWLLLRSGSIDVKTSNLSSPKGMIHLEAKAGDLNIANSTLDVGVHALPDLLTPINQRNQDYGITIDSISPPPSIGLFAAHNLDIKAGSRILATQDITVLRDSNPPLQRSEIRLNDTSGIIAGVAGYGLTVRDGSRIEANASDNLAGNIILLAKAGDGLGDIAIENATLSASGGAGSGDIRLHSANGIRIEANSLLLAESHNKPESRTRPGSVNWRGTTTFSGGEISLTNGSDQKAIIIQDSKLRAEQSSSERRLSTLSLDGRGQGRTARGFVDDYDSSDRGSESLGGIINLVSGGGLLLSGPQTLVSVDSRSQDGQEEHTLGGTIRVFNIGETAIRVEGGAQFSHTTSQEPITDVPSRPGELLVVDPGSIPVPEDFDWGTDRAANPYLLLPGNELKDAVVTGGDSTTHVDGVPGEIRDRINPAAADQVFPNGPVSTPLPALPAPPSEPLATPAEDQLFATDREAHVEKPWLPMASLDDGLSPLISPTSVALASPAPEAAEASLVAVSQAIPEEAAVQSFQASEQQSAREVSAALGLQPPKNNRLEIATLQVQLRAAFPQPISRQVVNNDQRTTIPAILQISSEHIPNSDRLQINHILIPATGEIRGWQTSVPTVSWQQAVKAFQQSLSQNAQLDGAGERLSAVLLNPVLPELQRLGVTTLLLSLDRGLQGIPFAALPTAAGSLVQKMAITITPSLTLTDLDAKTKSTSRPRALLAGSREFTNGLVPLPMVDEELRQVAALHPEATILMDNDFNNQSLLAQIKRQPISVLHLATHAEFTQEKGNSAQIYTHSGQVSLQELGRALRLEAGMPLSLFVLNACRTAVGNEGQELGIAGLALQAGATSALGNLWYVDDVVAAAFSVQFHRAIQQGLPSDQALRNTQQQFMTGQIKVHGNRIVNWNGDVLIQGLSRADQARLNTGLDHPYFWAGAILSGRPW